METIEQRMFRLVRDHMFWGDDERWNAINKESAFIDDLGADSLDLVELVMAAEEEFDIEILDAEAEQLLTIGDAVKFIQQRQDAR